jgi:uncharacterized protein YjiS (DUF1127 family)
MTTRTATWDSRELRPTTSATGLFEAIKRRWSQRRTNLLLADLDDLTLKDIGLDRSQVRRTRQGLANWVVQTNSGTQRIVFFGHLNKATILKAARSTRRFRASQIRIVRRVLRRRRSEAAAAPRHHSGRG